MTCYIQQKHAFWGDSQDDKTLRAELKTLGIDGRRMSRFSQLALLGALPLREYLTPNTPIFLGSPFASPSKFNKMFTQLNEQDLPSPLDFMANLNNAATFLLAQQCQTTAPAIFVAVDSQTILQPLKLALLGLENSPQVLVGWAVEQAEERQPEGSVWWLISKTEKGTPISLATLTQQMAHADNRFPQTLENLIQIV